MNLIVIIARYNPYIGGAEKQAERMATALVALGHNVTVLTRHEEGAPCRENREGVKVCRLPFLPWGVLAPLSFMFCCLLCILFRRRKTDLLHAHQPDSILTGTVASMLTGIPLIGHFHGALPRSQEGRPQMGRGLKGKIMLWLMNRHLTQCVAVSKELAGDLECAGITKTICCLPGGVDTQQFRPASPEEKTKLRRRLGLPEQGVVLVFAGRWERVKGLDLLFAAWKKVHLSSTSRCLLVILGTGSMADQVFSRGARLKNCILLGPVDNVPDYLQAADIMVMPSRYEGTSLAVLEAMSCGLAVLVTSVGGNVDLICHEQSGILVPPENVDQLAVWLRVLMADPGVRRRLGELARAKVVSCYSLEGFMQDFEDVCLEATGKGQMGSDG